VTAALDAGARLPRGDGPEGKEPILSPREHERARDALLRAPPAVAQALAAALAALDGPAAAVARAVFLRATAARHGALTSPSPDHALAVLLAFAERLGPLDASTIKERSSALDLDSRASTSDFDPQELWTKRGVLHDRGQGDEATDNDGLFQRFTGSCGPTTLQMMLAEADPVAAFDLHEHGLCADATDDPVADFQRRLLEAYGGISIGRREAHLRARLRNALGRVKAGDHVRDDDAEALLAHALKGGALTAGAARALAACREHTRGFPSDDELARLARAPIPERDEGILPEALQELLDDHLTKLTGVRYRQTNPVDGFARGQAWRHLDDVTRALRRGVDVPFGIVEPGHWMLLSAVKGRKPKREFLVSDPDGGRTAWVSERSLVRGSFGDDPFGLPEEGQRPYVDCFFLPAE
jgi:hypothetical protein